MASLDAKMPQQTENLLLSASQSMMHHFCFSFFQVTNMSLKCVRRKVLFLAKRAKKKKKKECSIFYDYRNGQTLFVVLRVSLYNNVRTILKYILWGTKNHLKYNVKKIFQVIFKHLLKYNTGIICITLLYYVYVYKYICACIFMTPYCFSLYFSNYY